MEALAQGAADRGCRLRYVGVVDLEQGQCSVALQVEIFAINTISPKLRDFGSVFPFKSDP